MQTVFPQVATSIEINDLLKIGRNITRYHLTETTGFPVGAEGKKMGRKGRLRHPRRRWRAMSSSCIISCLAMRNTRRLRQSGRSVRKLYQYGRSWLETGRNEGIASRRRPRRRHFHPGSRRRRAARMKSQKSRGAAATSRRKGLGQCFRKHRRMTFLSRKVDPDGTHASKENARESSEAESGGFRRHFRAENSGFRHGEWQGEKQLPAAVPRMEAVHREVRRMWNLHH